MGARQNGIREVTPNNEKRFFLKWNAKRYVHRMNSFSPVLVETDNGREALVVWQVRKDSPHA